MTPACQFVAAVFVGAAYYLLAMAMTVYDGLLSLICQPVVGLFLTAIACALLLVLGLPLRLVPALRHGWRRHWWMAFVLGSVAFGMMCLSWMPAFRIEIHHPDLEMQTPSFHPWLALSGWLLTLFAVLHFEPPMPWRKGRAAAMTANP